MTRKLSIFAVGLIVVFSAVIALAEGERPDCPRRRAKGRPRIHRRLREKLLEEIRELLHKRRSGDELTDEEKAKLKEFMMRRPRRRPRRPKAESEGTAE